MVTFLPSKKGSDGVTGTLVERKGYHGPNKNG
jgi:hypothetical protein